MVVMEACSRSIQIESIESMFGVPRSQVILSSPLHSTDITYQAIQKDRLLEHLTFSFVVVTRCQKKGVTATMPLKMWVDPL